jgi:enoyl-CoA hydratase/carnithine racemase
MIGVNMSYKTFIVERSREVATVYLNQPEKLNPIDLRVMEEFLAITRDLQDDEETRVVVLTGKGRAFCVGADFSILSTGTDPEVLRQQSDPAALRFLKMGRRITEEWERLDKVTIASINGFAIGGGVSLAIACDFRIAAAGTRMRIPELSLGMTYGWGSISHLIDLVGMVKAKELVMTGDELTAEEALSIGLVNDVVPAGDLVEATQAFVHKLVTKPPMALLRTKEFFKALTASRTGDITYADAHLGLTTFASDDMREAVAAFKEKRQPKLINR